MKNSQIIKLLTICFFAYAIPAQAEEQTILPDEEDQLVQISSNETKVKKTYNFKSRKVVKRMRNTGGLDLFAPTTDKKTISYKTNKRPGSIIVNAKEKRLYYVLKGGKAISYGIGVARPGFEWRGTHTITRKAEWPNWTPPPAMLKREPGLKKILTNGTMKGGEKNPLGARALYIGSTIYRIHGTNNGRTIGHNVSSGCIRLHNKDIIDLYNKVKIGSRVYVN